jgi:hypothetical protein
MKKFKSFCLITVLSFLLFVFLTNCEKEEVPNLQSPQNELLTIEDGIVYFKDRCAFENTMYMLHSKGQENLSAWEKEIGFNNSLRSYMEMNSGYLNPEKEIISDPYFAAVINKDGIFAIGDTVHKLTFDIEYISTKENLPTLREINKGNAISKTFSSEEIKEFPISRKIGKDQRLKSISGTHYEEVWSPCGIEFISPHLYRWCTNTLAYASIGIKIVGRKRPGTNCDGIFANAKMSYAKAAGITYFLLNGNAGNPDGGPKEGTNTTTVENVLTWCLFNVLTCQSIEAQFDYQVEYDCGSRGHYITCTQHYDRFWD